PPRRARVALTPPRRAARARAGRGPAAARAARAGRGEASSQPKRLRQELRERELADAVDVHGQVGVAELGEHLAAGAAGHAARGAERGLGVDAADGDPGEAGVALAD